MEKKMAKDGSRRGKVALQHGGCGPCATCAANGKVSNRCGILRRKYGISEGQFNELLLKQEGKCAICKADNCSTGRSFAVDHCHETGRVRGLLCFGCNASLAWAERHIETINKYL